MLVRELMTPYPLTVSPEATLRDALRLMRSYLIRHLPVVTDERLVGVISERDLLHWITPRLGGETELEGESEALDFPVAAVMVRSSVTVRETDSPAHAADVMIFERIGALPVVNQSGRLVGIVSAVDLLADYSQGLRDEARFGGRRAMASS